MTAKLDGFPIAPVISRRATEPIGPTAVYTILCPFCARAHDVGFFVDDPVLLYAPCGGGSFWLLGLDGPRAEAPESRAGPAEDRPPRASLAGRRRRART